MTYYRDETLLIRDLLPADINAITDGELAQGWHPSVEKYTTRISHRDAGRCISLVAEYEGNVAGYINVYPEVTKGPFLGLGYAEVVDFGVLNKYRKKGIGNKLMDVAEEIAARYSDTVCLSVGLHSGYGSAQRIYVKRGYLPDGTGAWYRGENHPQYQDCCNDDHLVLYFSKKIK